MTAGPDRWLVRRPRTTTPSWRMLCIPHAGAGAAALSPWFAEAPQDCELVVARLPGRESRLAEASSVSIAAAAAALLAAWRPLLDRPYVVFGYSMGALVAYELTRALAAGRDLLPDLLAVGGHSAPQRPSGRPPIHDLPDAAFAAELRRLGGTPDEVLDHPDLFALLAPTLRGDLRLVHTYEHTPAPRLAVPIATYTGVDDEDVAFDDVLAWQELSDAEVEHRRFPGGHFFFAGRWSALLDAVVTDYRVVAAGGTLGPQGG